MKYGLSFLFAAAVVYYSKDPHFIHANFLVKLIVFLAACLSAYCGFVIGKRLRDYVKPDWILADGFAGLFKARIFWDIGPQALGCLLGAAAGFVIIIKIFGPSSNSIYQQRVDDIESKSVPYIEKYKEAHASEIHEKKILIDNKYTNESKPSDQIRIQSTKFSTEDREDILLAEILTSACNDIHPTTHDEFEEMKVICQRRSDFIESLKAKDIWEYPATATWVHHNKFVEPQPAKSSAPVFTTEASPTTPQPGDAQNPNVSLGNVENTNINSVPLTAPIQYVASGVQPSFDCGKVTSLVNRTICSNSRLASLDVQLSAQWKKLYQSHPAGAVYSKNLLSEQRLWIREKNACNDSACIDAAYNKRISEINSALIALGLN